jgi:hypothetical protein
VQDLLHLGAADQHRHRGASQRHHRGAQASNALQEEERYRNGHHGAAPNQDRAVRYLAVCLQRHNLFAVLVAGV